MTITTDQVLIVSEAEVRRLLPMAEAGDILLPIKEGACSPNHIHATLGEIINGTKPGRTSAGEITLFKSLGLGVEDVAAARFIYSRAQETGCGQSVTF